MNDDEIAEFRNRLEERGELAVQSALAAGRYSQQRVKIAEAWLQEREAARNDASSSESLRIARSAKNAAWAAAIAAMIAIPIAIVSLVISVLYSRA